MSEMIVVWLKSTALSHFIITQRWVWPICETFHFIGLALLIGTAGLFDLRLMGWMRRMPVDSVMQMRPWAAVAIVLNLVTGSLFFIGAPDQYINNPAWWGKVSFLVIAMLNIAFFETTQGRKLVAMPPDQDTPLAFKVAGAISITSWFAVLYFGRMLPFIGKAF